MISDEYTREYDEMQKVRALNRKIDTVEATAKRFGCTMTMHIIDGNQININIYLPNGKLFHRFLKLQTAVDWAERWINERKKCERNHR